MMKMAMKGLVKLEISLRPRSSCDQMSPPITKEIPRKIIVHVQHNTNCFISFRMIFAIYFVFQEIQLLARQKLCCPWSINTLCCEVWAPNIYKVHRCHNCSIFTPNNNHSMKTLVKSKYVNIKCVKKILFSQLYAFNSNAIHWRQQTVGGHLQRRMHRGCCCGEVKTRVAASQLHPSSPSPPMPSLLLKHTCFISIYISHYIGVGSRVGIDS